MNNRVSEILSSIKDLPPVQARQLLRQALASLDETEVGAAAGAISRQSARESARQSPAHVVKLLPPSTSQSGIEVHGTTTMTTGTVVSAHPTIINTLPMPWEIEDAVVEPCKSSTEPMKDVFTTQEIIRAALGRSRKKTFAWAAAVGVVVLVFVALGLIAENVTNHVTNIDTTDISTTPPVPPNPTPTEAVVAAEVVEAAAMAPVPQDAQASAPKPQNSAAPVRRATKKTAPVKGPFDSRL